MSDCLFCKIIDGSIPSYTVYEDDKVKAMLNIIREKLKPILSDKLNIDGLTISQNNDYGQEVKHFHIHVIPRYKNDKFPLASNCSKVEDVYHKLIG